MLLSKRTGIKRYRITDVENGYRFFTDGEKVKVAKTLGVKVRGVLWNASDPKNPKFKCVVGKHN